MCDNHPKKNKKTKFGSTLEHGNAHERDHKKWSRRDFLTQSGLGALGTAMMLKGLPIQAFTPTPLMVGLNNSDPDRILVLIRLKGGNDGLNMVIPRGNDEYYNIRPTLGIPETGLWGLSTDFGMPNEMQDLQSFWNDGRMKIIHNVGYPDANYSHFRSSDIWASSSDSEEYVSTGWMGRFLDNEFPAFLSAPPIVPPALQIGVKTNLIFQAHQANLALSISNPTEFYQIASSGELYNTDNLSNCAKDLELSFVRHTANSAFRYSETIREAYNNGTNTVPYTNNELSEQMAIIARLIKGNLGTRIYMVTIGGFDTHADQATQHPLLMNDLANSVSLFFQDLAEAGINNNVLAMTFSEFGRTIFENGSAGTDHGTGGPMLLIGGEELGSGFHGNAPDLLNVDMYGDPLFDVDFRSVYATILQDWLGVDSGVVSHAVGHPMSPISNLVPSANPPLGSNESAALLGHQPSSLVAGNIAIKYAMLRRGTVRLRILNQAGSPLRTLISEFKEKGSYTFEFKPSDYFLPPGDYIYKLETGGKIYSRKIRW